MKGKVIEWMVDVKLFVCIVFFIESRERFLFVDEVEFLVVK